MGAVNLTKTDAHLNCVLPLLVASGQLGSACLRLQCSGVLSGA